jgi:hypothetical protein
MEELSCAIVVHFQDETFQRSTICFPFSKMGKWNRESGLWKNLPHFVAETLKRRHRIAWLIIYVVITIGSFFLSIRCFPPRTLPEIMTALDAKSMIIRNKCLIRFHACEEEERGKMIYFSMKLAFFLVPFSVTD